MTEQEIATQIATLTAQFQQLTTQLNSIQHPINIEKYEDVNVTVTSVDNVSLHIYRTLPEFKGERDQYATWRSMVSTAMKLLENYKTTTKYFEALMIIRNKVTGPASNILNNYNTAFNFEAIIDRLDFTYSDKRPLYVLEHELSILQQTKLSIDEFYDKVNEKLNAIINKINMTHKDKTTSQAFIIHANEKALRTFITGLNHKRGELLYASNPKSLPEAYARLQTIMSDQERIYFATRYNHGEKNRMQTPNPHFKFKNNQQSWPTRQIDQVKSFDHEEPMDIDKSSTNVNIGKKSFDNQKQLEFDNKQNSKRFDHFNQKRFDPVFKRERSNSNMHPGSDQKKKLQRFNNITDDTGYAKTVLDDEPIGELSDDEDETSSMVSTKTKRSSVFLGE